ncbi:MAG: hypothetical protein MI784_06895 [Cytophagales bacterium]|nr:hypothetical protein [Cytophagales bacterium]
MRFFILALLCAAAFSSCHKNTKEHKHSTEQHSGHEHSHDQSHQNNADHLSPEQAAEQALFQEVMAIHDSIMPEMGTIMKYKRQLKKENDSLSALSGTKSQTTILNKKIRLLDSADKAMMHWMHAFDSKKTVNHPHEEIMKYLNGEKEKIQQVKKLMEESIRKAKKKD